MVGISNCGNYATLGVSEIFQATCEISRVVSSTICTFDVFTIRNLVFTRFVFNLTFHTQWFQRTALSAVIVQLAILTLLWSFKFIGLNLDIESKQRANIKNTSKSLIPKNINKKSGQGKFGFAIFQWGNSMNVISKSRELQLNLGDGGVDGYTFNP